MRAFLAADGIDFAKLYDPWGNNYRVDFSLVRDSDVLTLTSAGADERFDTADDFSVERSAWRYFVPIGGAVERAVQGFHKRTGGFILDDFEHEIGTNFVVKGKGLVVLTSCSHRGVINTIRQAQAASGIQKVHAIIGGFHIVPPLTDEYIRQVIATFKEINPDYLIPGHCAGERFYDLVRAELPSKVIRSAVGTRFVFGA